MNSTVVNDKTMCMFTEARSPDDLDMVFAVSEHLKREISIFAAETFLKDPSIMSVAPLCSGVQRAIINRWFSNLLLRFRSTNEIPVTDALFMLINDGYIEDWFTIFNAHVLTFIKKNKVLI